MALPSNFYRDPAEILERLERTLCKGCKHLAKAFGKDFCEHPSRNGKAEKRCKHYNTGEEE